MRLVPASRFSIEELTAAYNQARADYLVPMQTTPAGLAEYMRLYDVDLNHSWLAVEEAAGPQADPEADPEADPGAALGIAMLGVRAGRAWVTRLGVLPAGRRRGVGETLVSALLSSARELGLPLAVLEVIQGNVPARGLFEKMGFRETRGLLVLRRPAGGPSAVPVGRAEWLGQEGALALLRSYPQRLPWTNEAETFINAGDGQAIRIVTEAGRGWLVFRRHAGELSHFVLHTEAGEPRAVGAALLAHLYERYPGEASYVENTAVDDPHAPALVGAGLAETFRRTEMIRREL